MIPLVPDPPSSNSGPLKPPSTNTIPGTNIPSGPVLPKEPTTGGKPPANKGSLAKPTAPNTLPGTSVPQGVQLPEENPFALHERTVSGAKEIETLHLTRLASIKNKYSYDVIGNASGSHSKELKGLVDQENQRYTNEIANAKRVEKQSMLKLYPYVDKAIESQLSQINLSEYVMKSATGNMVAKREAVAQKAAEMSKALGGGDAVRNIIEMRMSAAIDAKMYKQVIDKRVSDKLQGKTFETFRVNANGGYESTIDEKGKVYVAGKKQALDKEIQSYRQTSSYNARKEVKAYREGVYLPAIDAINQEYNPLFAKIYQDVTARVSGEVQEAYRAYANELQQKVKDKQIAYNDAVVQLRIAESGVRQELKRREKEIASEAQTIFDNQFGKDYKAKQDAVNNQLKSESKKIYGRHGEIYRLKSKSAIDAYNTSIQSYAQSMTDLQKKELVELESVYGSVQENYAQDIANYYKSKRTDIIFTQNTNAVLGNLMKGIGYKLEEAGISGSLIDKMKYGGEDAYNAWFVPTPELTTGNFLDKKVMAGALSQLGYAVPSFLGAGLAGLMSGGTSLLVQGTAGAVGWLSNSMMMQGDTYDQALNNGMTQTEAREASSKMALQQLAYLPASFLSANVIFGKLPKNYFIGALKGAVSTGAEYLQESTESAGQKVYVDPSGKKNFSTEFLRHDTQMEGITAAYTQGVTAIGATLLKMLLRGVARIPGGKKATVHAPDVQHMVSAINNTGNDQTSNMILDMMEDEGAVHPAIAEVHRQRFEAGKKRLAEAKAAGMNNVQAQLFISVSQDIDDKKDEVAQIENPTLKAAAQNEVDALEEKSKAIASGEMPVVGITVQGATVAVTSADAEQMLGDGDLAEAVQNGDAEIEGPADIVEQLKLLAAQSVPELVVTVAQDTTEGNIASNINQENNGEIQGQEEGQDVLTSSEDAAAQPQPDESITNDNTSITGNLTVPDSRGQAEGVSANDDTADMSVGMQMPVVQIAVAPEATGAADVKDDTMSTEEKVFEKERELEAEGYDAEEIAQHPDIITLKGQEAPAEVQSEEPSKPDSVSEKKSKVEQLKDRAEVIRTSVPQVKFVESPKAQARVDVVNIGGEEVYLQRGDRSSKSESGYRIVEKTGRGLQRKWRTKRSLGVATIEQAVQEVKKLMLADVKSETEAAFKEENKKQAAGKTKRSRQIYALTRRDPQSLTEAILQFFVGGGKISKDDFVRFTGFGSRTRRTGRGRGNIEFLSKSWAFSPTGEKADILAQRFFNMFNANAENTQDNNEMGTINAIFEILIGNNKDQMISLLEAIQASGEGNYSNKSNGDAVEMMHANLTDEEAAQVDDDIEQRLLAMVASMPQSVQNELLNVLKEYMGDFGMVNWDKLQKDFDNFTDILLSLSDEAQLHLEKLINDSSEQIVFGQGGIDGPVTQDVVSEEEVTPTPDPTPKVEEAPQVEQNTISAPAPVSATASALSEMTDADKKAEGKKFLKGLDDFFPNVLPKLTDKRKSLTAKYNRAFELMKAKAISQEDFDVAKERIERALGNLGLTLADVEALRKGDDYMDEIRAQIKAQLDDVNEGKKAAKKGAASTAKETAKKIRDHAKNVGKNNLNDALLGLPIAAYRAVLLTVANAIEAGATISDALKVGVEAVKSYILQFNLDQKTDAQIAKELIDDFSRQGIQLKEKTTSQKNKEVKRQIDGRYPVQYVNSKGEVVTRVPVIRATISLRDLAKKTFGQGRDAVQAVKDLQELLLANISIYGLKKFGLATFKKMVAILQSIGPDYDATDVYDIVDKMDDTLLYEANVQQVSQINAKMRKLKQLIQSGQYLKSSYVGPLSDVLGAMVSPFKVLKYAAEPVIALLEYEKTLDAILDGFGSQQGERGFSRENMDQWVSVLQNTADEVAAAELSRQREIHDELVKKGKFNGNFDEYLEQKRVDSEVASAEKQANRLIESNNLVDTYSQLVKSMQEKLKNKLLSGVFAFDKFIEQVAKEIAEVDISKLVDNAVYESRDAKMKANADSVRKLSQLNDIINNIMHDTDVNEAYAFIDKYISTNDTVQDLTNKGVKVRPVFNNEKKTLTNIINSMFFNKEFIQRFRQVVYQAFAFRMNKAKNEYYGSKDGSVKGVAVKFAEIINKHLGKDITDASRFRIGVVAMLTQYAREREGETIQERFDKTVSRIINIERDKMALHAKGQPLARGKRKFMSYHNMTKSALETLGLLIPNPSSRFIDANGSLDPLINMLTDGERELMNFMFEELNKTSYVNALKNAASASMGIDFEVISNYFPMYVYQFTGETKATGLDMGSMIKSMNGMRRMYVRPSDRNKKRTEIAGDDKYYSLDAFTNFLSAYYEGLSQIHAGREAKKLQYLLNNRAFMDFVGGTMNKMLGFIEKSDASRNKEIIGTKIQEVFDDYMNPVGIYTSHASFSEDVFEWAKDTMMGVYLKHPAQFWQQYIPNATAVATQVGPTYLYQALRVQALAIYGSKEDKAALDNFLANFSVSHRSAMGIVDDVSKQISTNKIRQALTKARDFASDKIFMGFTLLYADSSIANATTIASYIKGLVKQGVINSADEFSVEMMTEHAENINMLALTRAESETTELNNSSLKEERASVVKDKEGTTQATGILNKLDKSLRFAYLLKGFSLNAYMHFTDAIKRFANAKEATSMERKEAAREALAALSQIFIFNVLKAGVTAPLYTAVGVAAYAAITGGAPNDESDDERKQREASTFWRFVLNTVFDVLLGGSSALLEGLTKYLSGAAIDKGIDAVSNSAKEQDEIATLPYFSVKDMSIERATLNYNMNPYGKVANRYRDPYMGSVEPAFDLGKSIWELTPLGFAESKQLNEKGNELLYRAKLAQLSSIVFRSGLLDRLEGQFEKNLKKDPRYSTPSGSKGKSYGKSFGKSFGGGSFGKSF